MNLVCDEGVERPIVERLRAHGHYVVYVAELEPGIPDDVVLSKATELSAPCLAGLSNQAKADAVAAAVDDHSAELPGAFVVVTRSRVRIRRAPSE